MWGEKNKLSRIKTNYEDYVYLRRNNMVNLKNKSP
jgi:hypothetical protein